MFGLAARLVSGALQPLIDQFSASGTRIVRKAAFLLVAGLAMVVVLIALTIAFDLWIASLSNPIFGALAVAGVYLLIAIAALIFAFQPGRSKTVGTNKSSKGTKGAAPSSGQGLDDQIEAFAAPLLNVLQRLGLRREQLAVLTGVSIAKQLGPIPLIGLAIVAGFLIGRMCKSWRSLLSSDVFASLLSADLLMNLFRPRPAENEKDEV